MKLDIESTNMKKKNQTIFLCADLHFGHRKMTNAFREDGVTKQRPFHTPEDHDATIIRNWNRLVGPNDIVLVAGDLVINRSNILTIDRCNGEKILIKGNHDKFRPHEYLASFKDIVAVYEIEGFIITHIPIHPMEINSGRWKGNIHGHLHELRVMRATYDCGGRWDGEEIDPRYLCVSMEQLNYGPISLDDAIQRFQAQQPIV